MRHLEPWLRRGITIPTLQAFEMHDLHPLHPDASRRREARAYVRETIDAAAESGVPRVLTACGFGEAACADPFESCTAFYEDVGQHARARGVRILVELLSPRRAPAMTDPTELARLLDTLNADTFSIALDHLADAGLELDDALSCFPGRVEELQLRGPRATPPPTDFPLASTLRRFGTTPAVVCTRTGMRGFPSIMPDPRLSGWKGTSGLTLSA